MALNRREFLKVGALLLGNLADKRVAEAFCPIPDDVRHGSHLSDVIKATVLLTNWAYYDNSELNKPISHGTGFIYKKKGPFCYIVTNYHVSFDAQFPDLKQKTYLNDTFDGRIGLDRIIESPELDIAILRTAYNLSDRVLLDYQRLIPQQLRIEKMDTVWAFGYPNSTFNFMKGYVSEPIKKHDEDGWHHEDTVFIAPGANGESGSALLKVSSKGIEWIGQIHAIYQSSAEDYQEIYQRVKAICMQDGRNTMKAHHALRISQFESMLRDA